MSHQNDPDTRRRALIASVLAGGAAYALPAVASVGGARPASAQSASGPETGGGQPERPGTQGNGNPQRPADPGAGGLGRNTGNNPHHGEGPEESRDPPGGGGGGASASEPSAAADTGYFDEIGPGGRGFA